MSYENSDAYQVIVDSCREGIIACDMKRIIRISNKAASELFAYDIDELLGQRIELLIPKPLRARHAGHTEDYIKNPTPRNMGEGRDLKALRKDGTEFPVEISLNTAFLNNEQHTVAFIIDISERKKIETALQRSEEQLIQYAAQLEKRVSQRTQKLDETISELEKTNDILAKEIYERKKAQEEVYLSLEKERQLNELKSRFVSMASHEFRTPLSTILSSASLIEKYTQSDHQEKREKHIEKIKSSISNLTNILNDFLSLAKLEEGKTMIDSEAIEVVDYIKSIIGEMEDLTKEGQTISLLTDIDKLKFSTDKKIFKNIIINLISNAIKYSDAQKPIEVVLSKTKEFIKVNVKDNGMGIPQSEQENIFERFFRAKNATNIQGTGLGLNIVKKYIEMLKGNITFESKEGRGTIFKIEIPI